MDKPKVFAGKTTAIVRVWHKLVKTYFRYERKKFAIDTDKTDWLGGRLEGKAHF
jgi:hypothetical protein